MQLPHSVILRMRWRTNMPEHCEITGPTLIPDYDCPHLEEDSVYMNDTVFAVKWCGKCGACLDWWKVEADNAAISDVEKS
jgi:hypothetical protein